MHEMSVMEDIINIIETSSREKSFTRVKKIVLEVGNLSCIEPSALEFCFSVISKNTIAEEALLEIVRIPGRGFCLDCQNDMVYDFLYASCPRCGNYNIKKLSGDELRVKNLVVI